tara:strand:+ start:57575 stop:59119 length:1545 start_codon:yes stop_codon:yes gene_type:complete
MSAAQKLVRNITANWVGFAVRALVAFFLTPFVLAKLGPVQFAVWAVVLSLTGYYGLFNLGFRASLTQYLTRYLALEDYDQMNRSASTGFFSCLCVGVVVMFVSITLALIAPFVFDIPPELVSEVRWAIVIVGGGAALQFPFYVFTSVFPSTQRYDLSNLIGITIRIAQAAAIVFALVQETGLVGVAVAVFVTNLLEYVIRWRVALRILPQLSIQWSLVALGSFREFISYGLWNSVINGATLIITQSDLILIGIMLPVAAITPHALAAGLMGQVHGLLVPAASVFFPIATHLHAKEKSDALAQLFLHGSRFLFCISALAVCVGVYHAAAFFQLWIGDENIDPDFVSPATIFAVLAAATLVGAGKRIGNQVLMGAKRLRVLACLTTTEAICNIVFSVVFSLRYGLIGIAYGTLVSAFLVSSIGNATAVCRYLDISAYRYVTTVIIRPIIFSFAIWMTCSMLDSVLPAPSSWTWLVARGAIVCLFAIPLLFWVGFDRSDRKRFEPVLRKFRLEGIVA